MQIPSGPTLGDHCEPKAGCRQRSRRPWRTWAALCRLRQLGGMEAKGPGGREAGAEHPEVLATAQQPLLARGCTPDPQMPEQECSAHYGFPIHTGLGYSFVYKTVTKIEQSSHSTIAKLL